MSHSTSPVKLPLVAAILPDLDATSPVPVRIFHEPGGYVALFDPAREDRQSVWDMLTDLCGPLFDVTPAAVAA